MSLRKITLLNDVDVGSETERRFALAGSQVPATISCKGVAASNEDIALEKLVTGDQIVDLDDATAGDFQAVTEGGSAKVLNGDNNVLAIYSPGVYRIVTADVAYASDSVTVIVEH